MKQKTHLSNILEVSDNRARYDAEAKKILANKTILAWILKYVVQEFKNLSIKEIEDSIEGTPEISKVPVYPGRKPEAVIGMNTEDKIPNEGVVTYDIRFYAHAPSAECNIRQKIKLILNVEAQKSYYPGYDLVTRGVFYAARMISSQLDTEFTGKNYDDIKKVYSIWICMDPSNKVENTITRYHMTQEQIYGELTDKARYDLLEVIMICIGKDADTSHIELLRLLDVLFSQRFTPEEKEDVLDREFDIPPTFEIKEGMRVMCNLSDIIVEESEKRGLAIGIEKGMALALVESIEHLCKKKNMSIAEALDLLDKTMQDYEVAKELIKMKNM